MAQVAVELLLKLIRQEKIEKNVISLPVHFFEGNTTKIKKCRQIMKALL